MDPKKEQTPDTGPERTSTEFVGGDVASMREAQGRHEKAIERLNLAKLTIGALLCVLVLQGFAVQRFASGYEIREPNFLIVGDEVLDPRRSPRMDRFDPDVQRAIVKKWALSTFRVSRDPVVIGSDAELASSLTMGEARRWTIDYLENVRNPFRLYEQGMSVELVPDEISALRNSESGYVLEFEEKHINGGILAASERVRLVVVVDTDGDEETQSEGLNEFGIWITRLDVERRERKEIR